MKLRSNGKQADTMQKISEQANSLMQTLAEQAATTAVASKDRAREVSATVVSAAKERAPDRAELSEQVSAVQQKFSEDVVPTAREVALQAASIAIDLWHAGRAKAAEAAESSRQGVVAQAKHEAGRRAHGATSAVTDRASAVTDFAGGTANRAKSASKHAAETTVHTTRDTGAFIFWASAAAGVIYFALLSERRRNQVLKFASNSLKEVRKAVDRLTSEPRGYPEAQ